MNQKLASDNGNRKEKIQLLSILLKVLFYFLKEHLFKNIAFLWHTNIKICSDHRPPTQENTPFL